MALEKFACHPAHHALSARDHGTQGPVTTREMWDVETHSVDMYPGLTELTRMPSRPNSHAMERAIWMTAALLALYATQWQS